MANEGRPTLSFEPPPDEADQYDHLFSVADINKTGQLNGREAVDFFSKSKQPIQSLKAVWEMADNPKTNSLDKSKFFVAVRLIQLYQNNQKAQGPTLDVAPGVVMRPVYFEGITPPSQPLPTPAPPSAPSSSQNPPPQPQQPKPDSIATTATALATQDPYIMQPSEQVRYDQLFPQYEKDGFVYGKEAVELFSKSGLPKNVLRDVWNLVDDAPVDNRLSKLEFALAMHLIVCVSKKNLPMPVVLPPSLKSMKSKEVAPASLSRNSSDQVISPNPTASSSSPPQQGMGTTTSTAASLAGPPPLNSSIAPTMALQQPPPLPASNGMAITDAFNDMSVDGSVQSSVPAPELPSIPKPSVAPTSMALPTSVASISEATINTAQTSVYVHPTTNAVSASTEEELEKVRSVLQKLQAENVSLKAQLGQFSEEEKQVRGEITGIVNEIGVLSQELTTLRKQVIESKASLIEATSDLKAKIELRDTLKDLVEETKSTREIFDSGVSNISEIRETVESQKIGNSEKASQENAVQDNASQNNNMQSTFFGYESAGNNSQSVTKDDYVDVSATYYGVGSTSVDQNVMGSYAVTPSQNSTVASVASSKPTHNASSGSIITPEQVEQLKSEALRAEKDAASADSLANDISAQLENLRSEADRAQMLVTEKQNSKSKKKGFMRSGNSKALKKEIELAQEEASTKAEAAQSAEIELASAQAEASRLHRKAEEARKSAEDAEMKLAKMMSEKESQMVPTQPATQPPQPVAQIQQHNNPYPDFGGMPGGVTNADMANFDGFDSTFAPPLPTNEPPPPPPEPIQPIQPVEPQFVQPSQPLVQPVQPSVQSQPLSHAGISDTASLVSAAHTTVTRDYSTAGNSYQQSNAASNVFGGTSDVFFNDPGMGGTNTGTAEPTMSNETKASSHGHLADMNSTSGDNFSGIPSPPNASDGAFGEIAQIRSGESNFGEFQTFSNEEKSLPQQNGPSHAAQGLQNGNDLMTAGYGLSTQPMAAPVVVPAKSSDAVEMTAPVQNQSVMSESDTKVDSNPTMGAEYSLPTQPTAAPVVVPAKSSEAVELVVPVQDQTINHQTAIANSDSDNKFDSNPTIGTEYGLATQPMTAPVAPVKSSEALDSITPEQDQTVNQTAIANSDKNNPPTMSMGYSFGQSTIGSTSMDGGIPSPTNSMTDEYTNPFGAL